jgi:hypothetical protein
MQTAQSSVLQLASSTSCNGSARYYQPLWENTVAARRWTWSIIRILWLVTWIIRILWLVTWIIWSCRLQLWMIEVAEWPVHHVSGNAHRLSHVGGRHGCVGSSGSGCFLPCHGGDSGSRPQLQLPRRSQNSYIQTQIKGPKIYSKVLAHTWRLV